MRALLSIVALALVGAAVLQDSRSRSIALCVMALVVSGSAIASYLAGEGLLFRGRSVPAYRRGARRLATRD